METKMLRGERRSESGKCFKIRAQAFRGETESWCFEVTRVENFGYFILQKLRRSIVHMYSLSLQPYFSTFTIVFCALSYVVCVLCDCALRHFLSGDGSPFFDGIRSSFDSDLNLNSIV